MASLWHLLESCKKKKNFPIIYIIISSEKSADADKEKPAEAEEEGPAEADEKSAEAEAVSSVERLLGACGFLFGMKEGLWSLQRFI